MKFLILLSTCFLFSLSSFGEGGKGGGGGININGKNYTLSQLGLKAETGPQPYFLDLETIHATLKVIDLLDGILPTYLKGTFRNAVGSSGHTYQKLSVVDSKHYNRIKGDYQKYIDSLSVKGKFILAASTDDKGVTSLFPDFFAPETPMETRAIWLVSHEAIFYKVSGAKLNQVLHFEGALQAFINSPTDFKTWMPVYDSLANLGLLSPFEWVPDTMDPESKDRLNWSINLALYVKVLKLQGKKLTLANFFQDKHNPLRIKIYKRPAEPDEIVTGVVYFGDSVDPISLKESEATVDLEFFKRFYQISIYNFDLFPVFPQIDLVWNVKASDIELDYYEDVVMKVAGVPSVDLIFKLADGSEFHSNTKTPVFFRPNDWKQYRLRFGSSND